MKETELAQVIVAWLEAQHWDVYQEVCLADSLGTVDILAVRGPIIWAIECKKSFGIAVIRQAYRWHTVCRSVAVKSVSASKDRQFAASICRKLKIGVLSVYLNDIEVIVPAPILREHYRYSQGIRELLRPQHKTYAKAGTNSGHHWSPYQSTMHCVKKILKKHPSGATIGQIMKELKAHHYASDQSARSNLGMALNNWVGWCRVDTNVRPRKYYLNRGHRVEEKE